MYTHTHIHIQKHTHIETHTFIYTGTQTWRWDKSHIFKLVSGASQVLNCNLEPKCMMGACVKHSPHAWCSQGKAEGFLVSLPFSLFLSISLCVFSLSFLLFLFALFVYICIFFFLYLLICLYCCLTRHLSRMSLTFWQNLTVWTPLWVLRLDPSAWCRQACPTPTRLRSADRPVQHLPVLISLENTHFLVNIVNFISHYVSLSVLNTTSSTTPRHGRST